ncbi:hypothetical protein M8C21_016694, partial [Ambrosia artemisiifolia]
VSFPANKEKRHKRCHHFLQNLLRFIDDDKQSEKVSDSSMSDSFACGNLTLGGQHTDKEIQYRGNPTGKRECFTPQIDFRNRGTHIWLDYKDTRTAPSASPNQTPTTTDNSFITLNVEVTEIILFALATEILGFSSNTAWDGSLYGSEETVSLTTMKIAQRAMRRNDPRTNKNILGDEVDSSDGPTPVCDVLQWILINTKAKLMNIVKKTTEMVNRLFQSTINEKTKVQEGAKTEPFEPIVGSSFFLLVMVLLIVVVTRTCKL